MRILVLNDAIDPVAVATNDEWHVVSDAHLLNNELVIGTGSPDLFDYHVFIVHANRLTAGVPEKRKGINQQLKEMIAAGNVLICFIESTLAMPWLPEKLDPLQGSGSELQVDDETPLTDILSRFSREMSYGTQLNGWNRYAAAPNGQAVAVGRPLGKGWMLVLPKFRRPHLVVRAIMDSFIPRHASALVSRLGSTSPTEEPPDWLSGLAVPGTEAINQSLASLEIQLGDLQTNIKAQTEKLRELERFRELLWAKGENWLEPLVRDSLALLGIDGRPERPIDFVYRFGDEQELWIEIEGTEGCTQVAKGSQLLRYLADEPERAPNVTGAIIANPYRLDPPGNRPPPQSQQGFFSKPLVNLAEKQSWSLLTTGEVFSFLCRHLAGDEQAAKELRSKLQLPPA